MSSWMDGTHERSFVEPSKASQGRSMAWPSSLALDYIGRKLYWSDPLLKTIERIGLDGQNREIVLRTSSDKSDSTPYAMAYHAGSLYFAEFITTNGIKRLTVSNMNFDSQPSAR